MIFMKEGITMIMTELVIESQGAGGGEPVGGGGIRGGQRWGSRTLVFLKMNPKLLSSSQDLRIPIVLIENGFPGSKQKRQNRYQSEVRSQPSQGHGDPKYFKNDGGVLRRGRKRRCPKTVYFSL